MGYLLYYDFLRIFCASYCYDGQELQAVGKLHCYGQPLQVVTNAIVGAEGSRVSLRIRKVLSHIPFLCLASNISNLHVKCAGGFDWNVD